MKCPICRKPVTLQSPQVPFCSERCRDADLGIWASEGYVISTPVSPSDRFPDRDSEEEDSD